jgi:hypothetical protein
LQASSHWPGLLASWACSWPSNPHACGERENPHLSCQQHATAGSSSREQRLCVFRAGMQEDTIPCARSSCAEWPRAMLLLCVSYHAQVPV